MNPNKEYILCAAVYVDDGVDHTPRSYNYPKTGLVFCGWRHGDCLQVLNAWAATLTDEAREAIHNIRPDQLAGRDSGFMTSKGRYVDRKEAAQIAWEAGQTNRRLTSLFSEELY